MVQRTPEARFMGGAWVFPGGAVDAIDNLDAAHLAVACSDGRMFPWNAAAVRELVEETGVWLFESGTVVTPDRPSEEAVFSYVLDRDERFAGDSLWYFANWITPVPFPVRFDTRFFAATVPEGVEPIVDAMELVEAEWIRPCHALKRADVGEWDVAFPTRKILEFLGAFESTADLGESIGGQAEVDPIQPRLVVVDGNIEILMPDDPGFMEAAEGESAPDLLSTLERIIRSGTETHPEIGS